MELTSKRPLQLVTSEHTQLSDKQHTKPCSDCPWSRKSVQGWLGPCTKEEWVQIAHGEGRIDCHVFEGPQCAGAAIYRSNVGKRPRDRDTLLLPKDKVRVFSSPVEFLDHHVIGKKTKRVKRDASQSKRP